MKNVKEPSPLASDAKYEPKFITTTLPLPKDERTDEEKRCDRFIYFVRLCAMWGPDDALAIYVQDSGGKPPEHHDGECKMCRERVKQGWGGALLPITGEMLQSAARLARAVVRREEE